MRARYLLLVLALLGADRPPATGTVTANVLSIKNTKIVDAPYTYAFLVPVKRSHRGSPPGAGIERAIVQKGEQFVPRVLVVPVGAVVWFPNQDHEEHNVYSPTDPVFDLGRYTQNKKGKPHRFEDVDEFDIYCDVHRFMSAKVKVVNTPYIEQVTGGKVTFPNVAPGRYKLVAWAPNSGEVATTKEVVVTAGSTYAVRQTLKVQLRSRSECHDRKDHTEYPKGEYGECPDEY